MNAQQLRNSILQQAIQGKLVPQDPNDEPASVLLQRIRKEKERLVKEGQALPVGRQVKKKDLESKPIEEDEIPFEIPEGWEWCRIKEVFSMQAGKFVSASDISDEQTNESKYPCYGGNGLRGYVKKFNNDGYFTLVGRQGALCGNVQIAKGKFYATEHAVVTDGFGLTDVKWAYYFLTALKLNQYATATAQPGLAVSNVLEVLLPIPPLAEQRRIVAKIEELMPLVERYGKAQQALDQLNESLPARLRQSILQEAIQGRLVPQDPKEEPASELLKRIRKEKEQLVKEGQALPVGRQVKKKDLESKPIEEDEIPFEIPESWEWCIIGDLFAHNNGKQLNKGNARGEMMDYITTSNLYWEGFVLDKLKQMPFEENEIERCQARKGDLLVCEGGDIGRAAIWNYDYPIMLQNHLHKLRAYVPLCTEYFRFLFYYYNKSGMIGGKGIGIQGFSSKALHNTLVPLPPLSEQKRIVAKVEELFGILKEVK